MDNHIVNRVIEQMQELPDNLQRQVLDYVQSLWLSEMRSVAGSDLIQFAGAISEKDLQSMSQAIENGCEQVDANEW